MFCLPVTIRRRGFRLRGARWAWLLLFMLMLIVPAVPSRADSELLIPCHPQQPVQVQLAHTGAQVRAHLRTLQTRVPDSRRSTRVLFRLPSASDLPSLSGES